MSSMSVDPSVFLCQRRRNFHAAQWRILQKKKKEHHDDLEKKFISVDGRLKEKNFISADDIYLKKFISVGEHSQKLDELKKKRKFTPDDGILEVTNEVKKFILVDGLKLHNLENAQGRLVAELEMMAKRVEDEFSQIKLEVKEKINMSDENGREQMLKVGTMVMQNTRSNIEEVVTAMNEKISMIANASNEKFKTMNENVYLGMNVTFSKSLTRNSRLSNETFEKKFWADLIKTCSFSPGLLMRNSDASPEKLMRGLNGWLSMVDHFQLAFGAEFANSEAGELF